MAGSNRELMVVNEGREMFAHAMALAFDDVPGKKATHYRIDPKHGLILYWHSESDTTPLPYPMEESAATEFAWSYLVQADYGAEPDHDGDNGKGWMFHRDGWGHVGGSHYSIIAIAPCWAMYGK